jgi:DNA-binding FrmR family transcriptional regulator
LAWATAWEWNAQTLFLLALLEQPGRWLQLIDAQCLQRLAFNPAHPLARLQPLLQRLRREQGSCDGLLGWLQGDDPVHGVLVQQLFSVQQALDSARLPANTLLYTCVESDREACGDDLLGLLMFWGVLYHDPSPAPNSIVPCCSRSRRSVVRTTGSKVFVTA